MPALVPYGVNDWTLKHMTQTGKAWMKVEAVGNAAFFHVNASMADTSEVEEIHGGNFSFAVDDDGQPLTPICDPRAVFGYDTALDQAVISGMAGWKSSAGKSRFGKTSFPVVSMHCGVRWSQTRNARFLKCTAMLRNERTWCSIAVSRSVRSFCRCIPGGKGADGYHRKARGNTHGKPDLRRLLQLYLP